MGATAFQCVPALHCSRFCSDRPGPQTRLQQKLHVAAQNLVACANPGPPKPQDQRHQGEKLDPHVTYKLVTQDRNSVTVKETSSVMHLYHAWHQKGNVDCNVVRRSYVRHFRPSLIPLLIQPYMTPSKDSHGTTCKHGQAVVAWYELTAEARECARELFRAIVGDSVFAEYEQVFRAGQFHLADKVGPFLGNVIVWKCQVDVHRDGLDGEGDFCMVTNVGAYEGSAELLLPDLKTKFV